MSHNDTPRMVITRRERLRQRLRELDSVPDTTYRVEGDQVFVFEKLLRLVDEAIDNTPKQSLTDHVKQLMP